MNEETQEEVQRDYAGEAAKDGWVPQDEWKGPAEKWTDAQTFVENGEKITGIAVAKARKLETTVETLQSRISDMESTKAEFVEHNRRALEKERAEKAALIEQLEEQQVAAINEGDGQAYLNIKKKIEEVQTEPEPQPGEQPWARDWAAENKWYAEDVALRGAANEVAQELRRQGFPDTGRNFMDEVSRRVKEALPEKFENPNRKRGITNGEGTKTDETAPVSERSYEALDSEAKAACDRFVAEGLMTKEEYVNTYDWN